MAQVGDKHPDAKPLRGYRGTGVLEVVADDDGSTYRAVYTVQNSGSRLRPALLSKEVTRGIATNERDLDLIAARLRRAQQLHEEQVRANKEAT